MNNKCKVILIAVLAALLSLTACAGFAKSGTYTDGQFADVDASAWFASDVKSACELALMKGTGNGKFSPNGEVTVAEAITMAARVNAAYYNKTIADGYGTNWYDCYVDYAVAEGIMTDGQYDSYTRAAKRYETAELFAKAVPSDYYNAINDVEDVPDIPASRTYKDEILTLYNAGVVMGSDSYGNFKPEDSITRAEASAIINRVAFPANRLQKTLDVYSKDDSFNLHIGSSMNSEMTGIQSGWVLDNRGGYPRTDIMADYTTTNDISETAGTALIREFNKTSTGDIVLDTVLTVVNGNGFYIEYQNDAGKTVYRAEIMDGKWCVLEKDGTYTPVYEIKTGESRFDIIAEVDLDNGRSKTRINKTDCGTRPLLTEKEETHILNFRYATTDKSLASYRPMDISIRSNYTLVEAFDNSEQGTVPDGWTAFGGTEVKGSLQLEHLYVPGGAGAGYEFAQINGKPVAEVRILLPEKESVEFVLKSGKKTVAKITTDEKGFYVNGETVYEDYYKNQWYRFRLELDTDTQKIAVKVNGRDRGEVDFAEAATSVDSFTLKNNSTGTVWFDNFKLFRIVEHDDYVPEPVVPKGADNYTVGMNVCSLWENGGHYGWATITPYDDPQPVLGYYDEKNPETADWEIKYLVEHGIDFQAFCLFFYHGEPYNLSNHLFDGFMNAKYSDMSQFCILLEAANGDSPATVEDWKERWVPYILENFIKHESYAVVDNRPVFSVFGTGELANRIGSYEKVKECFDYLEEEVIKLGFDGMIYLGNGSSTLALQSMGFDGCHAYNWGYAGFNPDHNIASVTASGEKNHVYTVPTISVGFNHYPWGGSRYPLMSKEDYRTAHEWVRDEYLPAFAEEPWQEKLVWLSTWNEYGEGTYIMPSTDEKGFQYIDVVREVYTDELADESLNTIPTEEQRYRINHLYPQYRRLLRAEGYYKDVPDESKSKTLFTLNAVDVPAGNLWSMKDIVKDANGVTAKGTNGDPIFSINVKDTFITDDVTHVKITAKIPKSKLFQMYYATGTNKGASESRVVSAVSTTDEMAEYYFSTDDMKTWGGQLNYIRFDPVSEKDLEFTLKSVEFIRDDSKLSKTLIADGKSFEITIAPMKNDNGDILVAFDPKTALDFRLSLFHEWDKENGVLKLHSEDCELVYTVGSDKYLLNGKEKELGMKLSTLDGLPILPLEKLCDDLGYEYTVNEDNIIVITTKLTAYYESIAAARVPGQWEFNIAGDAEGWNSSLMSFLVNGGSLAANSRSDVWTLTDYTIVNSKPESFCADDYEALEVRVRYSFKPSTENNNIKMYFKTDVRNSISEKNSIYTAYENSDSNGEWVTIRIPVPETFTGNVTYLRFDPFDGFGTIEIDYIRFIPKAERAEEVTEKASQN